MTSFMRSMVVGAAFIKNAFLKMLAYRLRYYTGIFTYLVFVAVYYYIWKAVYASKQPGESINGFSLPDMVTYVAIGWISRSFYYSNIDSDIDDMVRDGQIANHLIRPINFQAMMMCSAAGESLFRLVCFSIPISVVIFLLFPVSLPASGTYFLLFCLSTFGAFFIVSAMNFATGLFSFYTKSIDGVSRFKQNLIQLFSGLMLPISFFPGWLQTLIHFFPFELVASVPLRFYLGKIPREEWAQALLLQFFWGAALVIIGALFWKKAIRELTIQGG